MDIAGISQVMTANYENSKIGKEADKKTTEVTTEKDYKEELAATYEKSETKPLEQVNTKDHATIEKLKAEADLRTAQLRSLVEKMMLKQGEQFTTLSDAFDMIEEGTITVDDEIATEAAKEVAEDGYWGVEQTSERLFSFAKALVGNNPNQADAMLEALQRGFNHATQSWGKELPDICKKTLEATQKKLTDWKESYLQETETDSDSAVSETN